MTTETAQLDATRTVNETITAFPETIAVFNEFGIDSCCGGGVSLAIAAQRDGVDLQVLLQRLSAVMTQP